MQNICQNEWLCMLVSNLAFQLAVLFCNLTGQEQHSQSPVKSFACTEENIWSILTLTVFEPSTRKEKCKTEAVPSL